MRGLQFLILLPLFCNTSLSQVEMSASDKVNLITQSVKKEMGNNSDPGLSISVFHKGNYLINQGFGVTDVSTGQRVTGNSLFKNASTGKAMVALAILRLESQGKLSTKLPLTTYLKNVKPEIGAITIEQLLSHTSGLRDQVDDFGPGGISRHREYAEGLSDDMLMMSSGMAFSYSNPGYNILGAVIEQVTGQAFNEAMKTLVFDFLEMPLSTYLLQDAEKHTIAYGHSGSHGNFNVSHRLPDNAQERASGLMFTTAKELNHLLVWLMRPPVDDVERELKSKMSQILADTRKTGSYWSYGYGLFHSTYCNFQSIWHTGGVPGFSAQFFAIPSEDFSVVILTNGENVNRWNIIQVILEGLFGSDCKSQSTGDSDLFDFDKQEQQNLIGTYSQGTGPAIKVTVESNQLIMTVGDRIFDLKKNAKNQLVLLSNGQPGIAYSAGYDENGRCMYLQYWVRAFPRIDND